MAKCLSAPSLSSVLGPSQVPCTCQPGWWALGWAVEEHQLPWAAAERSVGHAVLFSPVVGTRPHLPTPSIASQCAFSCLRVRSSAWRAIKMFSVPPAAERWELRGRSGLSSLGGSSDAFAYHGAVQTHRWVCAEFLRQLIIWETIFQKQF